MTEIITTGGTWDKKLRDPANQDDYEFPGVTHVYDALQRRRTSFGLHVVRHLMWIDSLDMDESHFQTIATACAATRQERIVVIHGTDKMIESAKTVKHDPVVVEKIDSGRNIVFTGAMEPFSVNPAHAAYNLFHALEVADIGNPGVHIAMSGKVFDPDNVRKNYDTLRFETLD